MKNMNSRKIARAVLISFVAQLLLIVIFSVGHFASTLRTSGVLSNLCICETNGWQEIFLVSMPLLIPAIIIGRYVASYNGLPTLAKKNKYITNIFVTIFIYALSLLVYINAIVAVG